MYEISNYTPYMNIVVPMEYYFCLIFILRSGMHTDPTAESCWGKLCVFVEHMWVPFAFAPLDLLGTGASIILYF